MWRKAWREIKADGSHRALAKGSHDI